MVSLRRVAGGIVIVLALVEVGVVLAFAAMGGVAIRRPLDALAILGYLLGMVIPLAFILVGLRLLRTPRPQPPAAKPRARPPPIAVSPEEVADMRGPFTACPDCGYLGIRMPQIGDGLWPGGGELGDRKVCPRCGYQGLAVQFESGEDYAAFLRDLAATTT